ncbi:transcription termination factor NusA [Halothermothrix orenii]|uniref:Transcription termination/antitermination protein NusA n=1 Tax=Halothermothrix orenii (strain H 168 / OCM 544 / DSM 9562) TaxID=373903 RepID=B8CW70_HALOH|nr:transcription termination factor NusA [Halothermothrix orenii]ACL69539.1 NusA antitermination factor [Halothermothrix orenii H 168]
MNIEFLHALDDIEKEKGISKEVLIEAIETALLSAYKKEFGSKENVRVHIVPDSGEVHVYSQKKVVDEVNNERKEISLEEAQKLNKNYEPGDIVEKEVTPANFGRIAAQTAKQVVMQRIREAERDVIYEEYKQKEGEIITGTVQRFHNNNVLIDLGRTEALLPPSEQIPGELYEMGRRIKVYVVEVASTTKGPRILVSRSHPGLLKRLFEVEVPEIFDGIVEIKAVAREAGYRSKMAVSSYDENVDPVGSCVGPKGMRVQAVVDQLNGEKIDIIEWSEDPAILVANALNPAKVINVSLDEEEKVAEVVVPDFQLSLAIGKEGQNARLAAKLTGWKVDIKSESQFEKETGEVEKKIPADDGEKVDEVGVEDDSLDIEES